jgi:hypothetical protein
VVKETTQSKQGQLIGSFDIYNARNNQPLQTYPINENLIFSNIFAVVAGDGRALSEESKRKIGGHPIPFPTNIQMVMDQSELLKGRLIETVRNNVALFMN